MANGTIKQQSNTYLTGTASKPSTAYHTDTNITTISIPEGTWLLISWMGLGNSGNSAFNHTLTFSTGGASTVRSTEVNGGGSINIRVITGPATVTVTAHHNISTGTTVSNRWYAIKLL